jgi:hypothetical protein
LDLTAVSIIDCAGVEILRDVIHGVHEQGGHVGISRPWRLSRAIGALVGAEGFVFISLACAGAIDWFHERHPIEPETRTASRCARPNERQGQ